MLSIKSIFRVVLLIAAFMFVGAICQELVAQCPMCRIGAESNLKDGGSAAKGLNKGILYMFAMPYLLIMTLGYLWWKNRKPEDEQDVVAHS